MISAQVWGDTIAAACGAAIVILGGVVRWLFIRQSSSMKVDHYYWLLAADAFRRYRHLPVKFDGRYLLEPPEQAYPPGFGWLLSKLPDGVLRSGKSVWLCQAADAAALAVGLGLAAWLGLGWAGMLAALLVALFAPTLVAYNTQLNPRSFGNLFLVMKMASEILAVASPGSMGLAFWIIAALSTAAIWLTHKMTTQLMLFLWLPWALALGSPVAGAMPLVGLGLAAFAVGPGPMLYQCAAHLDIVRFWTRNWRYLGVHGIRRSPVYGAPDQDLGDGFHKSGWRGQLQHLKLIFGYAPAIVLMPATLILGAPWPPAWLLVWTVGSLTWAILTATVGILKGLGAGPLYVFFAVIPSALWLGFGVESGNAVAFATFVVTTLISALALLKGWRQRQARRTITEDGQSQLLDWLRRNPTERVAVFPLTATETLAGETRHAILWGAHGYGFDLLEPIFPRATRPLSETFARYGIERLVWNHAWWPEAEAALAAELQLHDVHSFGNWRTASIAGLPSPPKAQICLLLSTADRMDPIHHNLLAVDAISVKSMVLESYSVPTSSGGALDILPGRGIWRHVNLYRHLRRAQYDVVDCRHSGTAQLVVATLAGVPHRVGPIPRTRAERHLLQSGIWRAVPAAPGAAGEEEAQRLTALYCALYSGDYDAALKQSS